jgi:hypothetical protein
LQGMLPLPLGRYRDAKGKAPARLVAASDSALDAAARRSHYHQCR